jgi:hypothetical protein
VPLLQNDSHVGISCENALRIAKRNRRAVAGGRLAAVGDSAKTPERESPKKQNGPFPGPSISCTRPVENGLKESSALLFFASLLSCNRCRDEAASQLYPGQVVEVAALSSLHVIILQKTHARGNQRLSDFRVGR